MNKLPAGCTLRPARADDIGTIRKLVWSAKLDPTQLRWSQFWVIECQETRQAISREAIVACGQLRQFPDAQELGSLVVAPTWRETGLGTYLTQHLIQEATQPLYLECLGTSLAEFYQRQGFVPIRWQQLPPALKRKFGLSHLASKLLPFVSVTIMHYPR